MNAQPQVGDSSLQQMLSLFQKRGLTKLIKNNENLIGGRWCFQDGSIGERDQINHHTTFYQFFLPLYRSFTGIIRSQEIVRNLRFRGKIKMFTTSNYKRRRGRKRQQTKQNQKFNPKNHTVDWSLKSKASELIQVHNEEYNILDWSPLTGPMKHQDNINKI